MKTKKQLREKNKRYYAKHREYILEKRRLYEKEHRKYCLICGKPITHKATYCTGHARVGDRNGMWCGGRMGHGEGYIQVLTPTHPNANVAGHVFEHRLVMEAHVGRTLLPSEIVHHVNGIRDDNRVENLILFPNHAEHARHHAALRKMEGERKCDF